jgi:hypothetical protein
VSLCHLRFDQNQTISILINLVEVDFYEINFYMIYLFLLIAVKLDIPVYTFFASGAGVLAVLTQLPTLLAGVAPHQGTTRGPGGRAVQDDDGRLEAERGN